MKIFGIDISEFQSNINLKKAKQEGVKFVMIRAGFTGSSNGISKRVDSSYEKHYKNAKKLGLGIGTYWFSRATSYEKGKSEAEYMYKNCLKGKTFEYPIAIDVEDTVYQSKTSKKQITDAIKGFCEFLENKGYFVSIYANSNWFKNKINIKDVTKYDKWLANWCKTNPKKPEHGMWQFGGSTNEIRSNKVAGIVVDQDYAYKDYPNIIKEKGLNGYKKKEKYNTGEYITLQDLKVRTGPGIKYSQKLVKELTRDGQKNATSKNSNDKAMYKKGTIFTATKIEKEGKNYWAKTPSGYVCIALDNKAYCKKYKK